MAGKKDYEKLTEALVLPITERFFVSLYDVDYLKEGTDYILRVTIEKEGGVTIEDCENVSRALSAELDEKDFIKDPYILEVSSPGLNRPIKKEKDFIRNIGKEIEVHLYKGKQKEFVGVLTSFDSENIKIKINEEEKEFSKKEISALNEYFDFDAAETEVKK